MQRKTHKPTPYRDGCRNQVEYEELYTTPCGDFKGTVTYVDFTDAKGKNHLKYFLRIKWEI